MKRRSLIRVAVAAAGTLALLPAVPSAAAAEPAPAGGTLVTGDRVVIAGTGPDAAVSVAPAQRYAKFFRDGSWYVIPSSVASLAGSGVLNREAFNVTKPSRQRSLLRDEAGSVELTVRLLDRAGQAAGGSSMAYVLGIDNDVFGVVLDGESLLLPPGRYAVHSLIETAQPGRESSYANIVHPDLRVDADAKVVLDARTGRRVSATVDEPAARGGIMNLFSLTKADDGVGPTYQIVAGFDPRFDEVYAASVDGVVSDRFAFAQRESRREPEVELFATGAGFEVPTRWFLNSPEPELRTRLSAVHGGEGRPEDLAGVDAKGKLVLVELPGTLTNEEAYERIRNVQAAGATIALVVTGRPGSARRADGDEPAPFTIPALYSTGATALRLADAVRAGATPVSLATHPVVDHRYELAFTAEGAIPARLERRVRDRDLAAVRTSYHDSAQAPARYIGATNQFWGVDLSQGWTFETRSAVTRTEYFTPGTWDLITHGYYGALDNLTARDVELRAGATKRLSWNKAVAGPSLLGATTVAGTPSPWVARDGNVIRTRLPLFADAAGHPRQPAPWVGDGTDAGSQTLYRDGKEIATTPAPDEAEFEVPAEAGSYRLVADATRTADWWPLSTRVGVAWTFRSAATDAGRALPLPTVRFDPELDLRNTAPGGKTYAIPVTVDSQGGTGTPRVRSLTVEASYDDGKTWQPARVTDGRAHVRHPASGFVSLRAKATTAGGETVEVTVIRAYQLRRPATRPS